MLHLNRNRNRLALGASIIALSISMVLWVDLFTFSKVVHLPGWAQVLPWPMLAPSFLVFACLLPAAFGTDSLASSRKAITVSVLLAPFAAVASYALNPSYQDRFLPANALFTYFWVIGWHCLLPALIIYSGRLLVHFTERLFGHG
jgi:hypothetical protein